MNYIKKTSIGIEVDGVQINTSLNKYLNLLLSKTLTTLDGRIKSTKKMCNIGQLPPIYIDQHTILVANKSLREHNVVLLNICNVYLFLENEVIFHNLEKIPFSASSYTKQKMIQKGNRLLKIMAEK